MKILYIHQYFKTPEEGGAIRSWYISNAMVEKGHSVDMVTAHNGKDYKKVVYNGITVHYLPVRYKNEYGFLRRLFAFLLFAHKAYYFSRKIKNVDLAYITSTPLTVGLTALMLHRTNKTPFVFEVRDLWPEAPIQIGMIRSSWMKAVSRKLERYIYRKSDKVVALSPGIKEYIAGIVNEEKIHFCPNMSDCGFFRYPSDKNPELEETLKLEQEFVIGYFGAIGRINALEYLLNLAKSTINGNLKIRYLIIGDGAMIDNLKDIAEREGLRNVAFINHMGKEKLREYLKVIDAAYVSFADFPILENNSPNKFFDALASGKYIISNVGGWISDLIHSNDCGIYIKPGDNPVLPKTLESIIIDKNLLNEKQANARKLAETSFDKEKLTKDLIHYIES